MSSELHSPLESIKKILYWSCRSSNAVYPNTVFTSFYKLSCHSHARQSIILIQNSLKRCALRGIYLYLQSLILWQPNHYGCIIRSLIASCQPNLFGLKMIVMIFSLIRNCFLSIFRGASFLLPDAVSVIDFSALDNARNRGKPIPWAALCGVVFTLCVLALLLKRCQLHFDLPLLSLFPRHP